ncbi:hypothetical protein LX97_02208 [Nonlabens dokdonensis]|uniref:Membrane protein n=2 Tax=Nonlabens dokdonensis TaxID=328515 RepID=L7W7D5_NONDD|nr:membrane protein [Nonlabens dokdonensis DSW-6]PZX39850.1 hypothetical protein LX97_02208 [Nonlabens dokdonensis]
MRLLKSILDFYIRSSLHVAVCFVALFMVFHFWNFKKIEISILLLLFCGVLIGYNLIKYAILILKKEHFRFKISILILTSLALIIAVYLVINDNLWTVLMALLASSYSLLYAFPLFKHRNWRQIPIIKLVTVAVSWIILICLLPLQSTYVVFAYAYGCDVAPVVDTVYFLYFIDVLQLFLLIIALCIPFEIKDLKYDSVVLKTLPQLVGTYNSKILGVLICVLYVVIEFIQFGFSTDMNFMITYFILTLTAIAIWFSDKVKSDYYASFFVEAIPVLWLGFYWVF